MVSHTRPVHSRAISIPSFFFSVQSGDGSIPSCTVPCFKYSSSSRPGKSQDISIPRDPVPSRFSVPTRALIFQFFFVPPRASESQSVRNGVQQDAFIHQYTSGATNVADSDSRTPDTPGDRIVLYYPQKDE